MSRIIQDVEIKFKGKDYTCKPTFAFIDMVEKRQSFFKFTQMAGLNERKISDIAWVIYCALKNADVSCFFEEVGEECICNLSYFIERVSAIILATFPDPKEGEDEDFKKKTSQMT